MGDELEVTGWENKQEAEEVPEDGAGCAVPRNPGNNHRQLNIREGWDLG